METLKEIGQYVSATLFEKLKLVSKINHSFKCSLDPTNVQPLTAKWDINEVNLEVMKYVLLLMKLFTAYCCSPVYCSEFYKDEKLCQCKR